MKNLEIIDISTRKGKLYAIISYQKLEFKEGDINNGYDIFEVPVNLRPLQYSAYGNLLCDQSVKDSSDIKFNDL